mmetsp:Transcript_10319/g.1544  ORF Transcript_10319/g.1544 Transcript_10319/m.1544 type:complete len:86 (-) Transcript_10319:659-916(-)
MASQLLNSGLLLGIVGGGALILYNSLFTVEAGHRAIMYNKISGINNEKFYSEGTHFKLFYFDRPIRYDVRTKPRVLTSLTGTKDL